MRCLTCNSDKNVLIRRARIIESDERGMICNECYYQKEEYGYVISDENWARMVKHDKERTYG